MKSSQFSREVNAVKTDTKRLMDDLASVLETLIEMGKTQAGESHEKLVQNLEGKILQLREGVEQVRDKGIETKNKVEEEVIKHPWISVFTALGVGFVLGRILLRK